MIRGVIAVAIVIAVASPATAFDRKWSLNTSILFNGIGNEAKDENNPIQGTDYSMSVQIGFGRFVTRHLESGLDIRGSLSWNNRNDALGGSLDYLATGKWHFVPDGQVVPYIGGQAGATTTFSRVLNGLDVTSYGSFGGMAGINMFVSEQVSLFIEYNLLVSPLEDLTRYNSAGRFGVNVWFE